MNKSIRITILAIVFLSLNVFSQNTRFLALSDIHFNPFDQELHYPVINAADNDHNDTNGYYLDQVIGSAAYLSSHDKKGNPLDNGLLPKFIIISGDLLAHDFTTKFSKNNGKVFCATYDIRSCVLKTMDMIIQTVRTTQNGLFAKTPVYVAIGNNDSDIGDYIINSSFLTPMGEHLYDYINPVNQNPEDKALFASNFKNNGGAYGASQVANTQGLNLLVLNSVLYADQSKALKCMDNNQTIHCSQLRQQQNNFIQLFVNSKPVTMVVMHIPPYDKDVGYSLTSLPQLDNSPFQNPSTYTIAGHWHQYNPLKKVNGTMIGSITFRKRAHPNINVFEYNPETGTIQINKHCEISNPAMIEGKTMQLPFICEEKHG